MAARHPEIEFVKASYLNDHPAVLDAFADRVEEILTGENTMNCKLCKYREQVLGFEAEVGLPQESHHHHVEGIGTDGDGNLITVLTITTTMIMRTVTVMGTTITTIPIPTPTTRTGRAR